MHGSLPATAWVSIGVALASLIIVPVGGHVVRKFLKALQRAKAAELAEQLDRYVLKTEHDDRADRMEKSTEEWREEQRQMFNTIRTEAYQRETLVLTRLDNLTSRVDGVFARSGRPAR